MDIINHYSAYNRAGTAAASQAGTNIPEVRCVSCDEFDELIKEARTRSVDQSRVLYNGSETRAKLSDAEIAVLANKYDVRSMSDAEFDSFLDDLKSMGALSEREAQLLGQYSRGNTVVVGIVENGKLISSGVSGGWMAPANGKALFNRQDANGDIFRWLNDRVQWKRGYSSDPEQRKNEEACEEMYNFLAGVVNRMEVRRTSSAEEARKKELVRQLADGNSAFYTNMRNTLKAQVEKSKEDQEEDEIIEALGKVLDALSEKKDASGTKKTSLTKSAGELSGKIGERIARLRREDPHNPEITKLENMLKRFEEMGIYIDLDDMDDLWPDEDETFETLTQLLTRRQAEEINSTVHPNQNEVNQSV